MINSEKWEMRQIYYFKYCNDGASKKHTSSYQYQHFLDSMIKRKRPVEFAHLTKEFCWYSITNTYLLTSGMEDCKFTKDAISSFAFPASTFFKKEHKMISTLHGSIVRRTPKSNLYLVVISSIIMATISRPVLANYVLNSHKLVPTNIILIFISKDR